MNGNLAFDTYNFVKRLQSAGFSEPQAEAQVALHSEVVSMLINEKLVTKEEFKKGIAEVKADIEHLRLETKNDIDQLRVSTKTDIAQLDLKFTGKFNVLYLLFTILIGANMSVVLKLFFHG